MEKEAALEPGQLLLAAVSKNVRCPAPAGLA